MAYKFHLNFECVRPICNFGIANEGNEDNENRNLNNKINRIHERALKIAYKGNVSNFEKLL